MRRDGSSGLVGGLALPGRLALGIGIVAAGARYSLWLGIPLLGLAALPAKILKTRLDVTIARILARRHAAEG